MTNEQTASLNKRMKEAHEELERCAVNAVNICAHVGGMGVDQIRRDAKNGKTVGYRVEFGTAPTLVQAAHAALWAAIVKVAEIMREVRPHCSTGWSAPFQHAHGCARSAVGLLRALEGVAHALHGHCEVTRASEHVFWLVDGAAGYGGWRAPTHDTPAF